MCDVSTWPSLLLTAAVVTGVLVRRSISRSRIQPTSPTDSTPLADDEQAVERLKSRFATGEIDTADFHARLDTLLHVENRQDRLR